MTTEDSLSSRGFFLVAFFPPTLAPAPALTWDLYLLVKVMHLLSKYSLLGAEWLVLLLLLLLVLVWDLL